MAVYYGGIFILLLRLNYCWNCLIACYLHDFNFSAGLIHNIQKKNLTSMLYLVVHSCLGFTSHKMLLKKLKYFSINGSIILLNFLFVACSLCDFNFPAGLIHNIQRKNFMCVIYLVVHSCLGFTSHKMLLKYQVVQHKMAVYYCWMFMLLLRLKHCFNLLVAHSLRDFNFPAGLIHNIWKKNFMCVIYLVAYSCLGFTSHKMLLKNSSISA
jgi:hypothetical protein